METLFMAVAVVACTIIMVPRAYRRKIFGYVNVADILGGMFILSHFAATASVSGLLVAVFAMLGLTLTLRLGRAIWGSEKLMIEEDISISAVIAGVFTQGVRWIKAISKSFVNGGVVIKPQPLRWQWVEELSPVTVVQGLRRFVATI